MSSGLECVIVERCKGEWFYVLQDASCPAQAWDWREFATAYGPFATEEAASRHLFDNHANPGGWSSYSHDSSNPDPTMEQLLGGAIAPQEMRSNLAGFVVFEDGSMTR